MDWRKVFKKAKEKEDVEDFYRVAELIQELYMMFEKRGIYKKK